jgi:hypothetical protein
MQDPYIMPVELDDTGSRELSVNQSYQHDTLYDYYGRQYSEYNLAHSPSQINQIPCITPNILLEKRVLSVAVAAKS